MNLLWCVSFAKRDISVLIANSLMAFSSRPNRPYCDPRVQLRSAYINGRLYSYGYLYSNLPPQFLVAAPWPSPTAFRTSPSAGATKFPILLLLAYLVSPLIVSVTAASTLNECSFKRCADDIAGLYR